MSSISFTKHGSGPPIVLIHGFPLNQDIWTDFAKDLSKSNTVFTIDLPGFGKSPSLKPAFTIDEVAHEVVAWLYNLKIKTPVIVGHSLGGYIALAMARHAPDMLAGIVLFHSTAYADTQEKKDNRNKVLDFISKNGVLAFTSNFIPPLFADQSHFGIETVRQIAIGSTLEAVTGYTKAMRDRKDRTELLMDFHKPVMIISGEKDAGIPPDSVKKQAALSDSIELHLLPEVAHMGMFEAPVQTAKLVRNFTEKSNRP